MRTMYRVYMVGQEIQAVWRIAWQGEPHDWIFGDGFYAREGTGWRWCPENFSSLEAMAWKVSGMGGADDNSDPITQEGALEILAGHWMKPDSIDRGEYPTPQELAIYTARRRDLIRRRRRH